MAANLNNGESEGLLQRDVGEDAVRSERQAVDVADVVLGVALGIRHRAVEVVQVDEFHHLSQHLLGAARHAVYVVPVALREQNSKRFKSQMKGLVGLSSQCLIIRQRMVASLGCGVCMGRDEMPCFVSGS